jgi:large subunit ribosomal protein L32
MACVTVKAPWAPASEVEREEIERNCIMPNPKRRHSVRRTALRRAHDFLSASGLSECPSCHEKKLPHRACPKCGAYKGRAVLEVKEEK